MIFITLVYFCLLASQIADFFKSQYFKKSCLRRHQMTHPKNTNFHHFVPGLSSNKTSLVISFISFLPGDPVKLSLFLLILLTYTVSIDTANDVNNQKVKNEHSDFFFQFKRFVFSSFFMVDKTDHLLCTSQ